MPSQEPAMALAPASQESPWVKTADAKHFPSEHDLSAGSFEMVESDGKRQLLVKKDLKSKVTRKIQEQLEGKYRPGEVVAVDLGDRIVSAVVKAYAGEGNYDVVSEGRELKAPDGSVFRASEVLWRE